MIDAQVTGINHLQAVRALQRAGYHIERQGKHIIMSNGIRVVVVPRNDPINAYTMGAIARDAGLSIQQFKELL